MRQRTAALVLGILLTFGFSFVGGIGIASVSAADTLVVDNDGTAEYSSIQAAINNASAGDTVEIRPGTYPETIVVDKNLTVTAPDGATLDATNVDDSDVGVTIGNNEFDEAENVAPTIRGLIITRYNTGILSQTDGDWVVSNVTAQIIQTNGIDASDSNGGWIIRDSEISSTGFYGIRAGGSDGEWVIEDTVIRRSDNDAIEADFTANDWTIRNVSVDGDIDASDSDGNWVIEQSSVQDGVSADDSNGKWVIKQSIITDNVPISAGDTLGEWSINQSIINETSTSSFDDGTAIDAEGTIAEGIATDNWWGSPSGPDEDACVGNVDCSNPLTTRPSDVGYNPDVSSTQPQVDVDPSDLPGNGTQSNPYEIANASELQAIEDDLDANYELVSDIDASNSSQFNDGAGFDPVGNFTTPFSGSFDGKNRTITGVTIDRPNEDDVGLLGRSSRTATVTNVTLTELTVTGDSDVGGLVGTNVGNITDARASGSVTGINVVGGVAGDNRGKIQSATASGNVSGINTVGGLVGGNRGSITDTSASGSVDGTNTVGGLAGENGGGTIRDARASGSVNGTLVGGLVGKNGGGTIRDARASGRVTSDSSAGGSVESSAGGLVGRNGKFGGDATIRNATASGSVNSDGSAGGLVGRNGGGTVRDTFAVGDVSGDQEVGGLVGINKGFSGTPGSVLQSYFDIQATDQNTSAGFATGLTTTQMQGQGASSNMSGLSFGTIWQTQPDDYPTLIALQEGTVQRPNITIQSIEANETTIIAGQTVELTATLRNDGESNGTIQLDLVRERDNQRLDQSPIITVNRSAEQQANFTVTVDQPETLSIQGPTASQEITINVAQLTLNDAVIATPRPVTTNETVVVNVAVENPGTAQLRTFLNLNAGGVFITSSETIITPGETKIVQLRSSLSVGTQNLTVTNTLNDQRVNAGNITVDSAETPTSTPGDGSHGGGSGNTTTTTTATLTPTPTATVSTSTDTLTPTSTSTETGTENDGFGPVTALTALFSLLLGLRLTLREAE